MPRQDNVNAFVVNEGADVSKTNPLPTQDQSLKNFASTDGFETIDHTHKEIHDGNYYTISKLFTSVADNGFADLRIKSTTKKFHGTVNVNVGGKCYVSLYKGSTYVGDGTAVTPINNNFNSTNVVNATAFHTPNTPTTGTLVVNTLLGGVSDGKPLTGVSSSRVEYISKPTEDVLVRVQNKSGGAIDISIVIEGYETI